MPGQHTPHSRNSYAFPNDFPNDFPERIVRFKKESGLSWAEMSRRLGAHSHTQQAVEGRRAAWPIQSAEGRSSKSN